jgi:hypothetical protein
LISVFSEDRVFKRMALIAPSKHLLEFKIMGIQAYSSPQNSTAPISVLCLGYFESCQNEKVIGDQGTPNILLKSRHPVQPQQESPKEIRTEWAFGL